MLSTQQRMAAVLAVACLGLLSWTLFLPSGSPSISNRATAAAWLLLPTHASSSPHGQQQQQGRSFDIQNDRFMLDGQPVQLLSGSVHYFRIPPDQWAARLAAVKAMGLNAVQVGGQQGRGGCRRWGGRGGTQAMRHAVRPMVGCVRSTVTQCVLLLPPVNPVAALQLYVPWNLHQPNTPGPQVCVLGQFAHPIRCSVEPVCLKRGLPGAAAYMT